SGTYVILEEMRVVGYYSLAAGSVAWETAPGRVRRNMPEPIPVVVLGRLAIDRAFQGQGLGRALLRDALLRIITASDIIGVRAILVHPLSGRARRFYKEHGFVPSPVNRSTLMVTVAQAMKEFRTGS
ncbi:MAG: GNAT family N-acetyltransferase, partial [Deltaproteobacteria bacterium]|nr:GNAT family N-acetyltransferase [Deltaproteobacteria bacterium]